MPIVMAYCDHRWLPNFKQLREDALTPQMRLTEELLTELPRWAATVINDIDGSRLTVEDIDLVPLQQHPWASNVSELWIDLQPTPIQDQPEHIARQRRWQMVRRLAVPLQALLETRLGLPDRHVWPTVTISCRPLADTGVAWNRHGTPMQQWGAPPDARLGIRP